MRIDKKIHKRSMFKSVVVIHFNKPEWASAGIWVYVNPDSTIYIRSYPGALGITFDDYRTINDEINKAILEAEILNG